MSIKRRVFIWSLAGALLYVAGFVVARACCCSVASLYKPDSTGTNYVLVSETRATSIFVPWSGLRCVCAHSLYYLYYPAGRVDRCLTERGYELKDAR
jgi:hypothetical protein